MNDGAVPSERLGVCYHDVVAVIGAAGASEVMVFGSVARGEDVRGSDLDLMVDFGGGSDIVDLLALEEAPTGVLGVPVQILSAGSTGPVVEKARSEAVPPGALRPPAAARGSARHQRDQCEP